MQNSEQFLKLYDELTPLKKYLAGTVDYKKLRFSYDDIVGFLDEKLIHVFMKYQDSHGYEEIKALAISSLHHMRSRVYRQYGRELSLDHEPELIMEEQVEMASMDKLMESLAKILPKSQLDLAKVVINPPVYVLSKIENMDKRIPSHLFLEFIGVSPSKSNVKTFNLFRRNLKSYIRSKIDPITFEPLMA